MQTFYYFNKRMEYAYALPGPDGTLPPDNATTLVPAVKAGFCAVWDNNKWKYVEDHRRLVDDKGVVVEKSGTPFWLPGDKWDSPARYMTTVGPLSSNALLSPPAKTVQEARDEKLVEIKNAFGKEESEGFIASSLGFRVDATRKSKADVDGLVQAMNAMGYSSITFRDYDNKTHTLSLDQVKTLQLELINKGLWNYQTKWDLEKKIASATTVEAVEKIVWPSKV